MDDSPIQIDTTSPVRSVPRKHKKGDPNRGRTIVVLISILFILLEGFVFLWERELHFIRWMRTAGLIFGLIAGVRWVRWVTFVLVAITLFFVLFVSISFPSPLLFGLSAYLAVIMYFLCGSKHVSAFFHAKQTSDVN